MNKEKEVKRYYKVSEYIENIKSKKNETSSKGYDTGFKCLDRLISYKRGYSSTIFSYAHSGKTQFSIEQAVWLARRHNLISVMYLTENMSKEEAILDILGTYLGKDMSSITDDEMLEGLEWLDKFFILLDISKSLMDIREIYLDVIEIQKTYDIKVDMVWIDHYLNLKDAPEMKGMTIADKVRYTMQAVTRTSKALNLHTVILFHVRDTDPIKCEHTKKWYLPLPEAWMLVGGQQSFFHSQQMISVYRPISREEQLGIVNPLTGFPFDLNELVVTVVKSKPKFIGKTGSASIYWNGSFQRYYERELGKDYSQGQLTWKVDTTLNPHAGLQPNKEFEKSIF